MTKEKIKQQKHHHHHYTPRHARIAASQTSQLQNCASTVRWVLTFDAFNETIEEAEKTKKEFEQLKKNQKRIEKTMSSMLKVIMGLSNTVEIHTLDDDPRN